MYIHPSRDFVHTANFCQMIPFVVHSRKASQYVTLANCNLCTALLCDPTALKRRVLLSVCLRYQPVPLPPLGMLLGCSWVQMHSYICECLHMLTVCLFYLQCCCTQTAWAELKHINHSRRLQLNYKDTRFLFFLIMRRLLQHAYWCCFVSTEPPPICSTAQRPHRCWALLLLQGDEGMTALFTFN